MKHIRNGATLSDAPKLEGIDESSFRRWRKCKNDQATGEGTLRDKRCWDCANCDLQRRCDEAEVGFKQECIQTVHKAMTRNWKAAAWFLEHRYRNDYSLKSTVEATAEVDVIDPSQALVNSIIYGDPFPSEQTVRAFHEKERSLGHPTITKSSHQHDEGEEEAL